MASSKSPKKDSSVKSTVTQEGKMGARQVYRRTGKMHDASVAGATGKATTPKKY